MNKTSLYSLLVMSFMLLGCSPAEEESAAAAEAESVTTAEVESATKAEVASAPPSGPKKPNILLLVGDDIGFGDLGISGSVTRTPNLDRLAKQGTFFTNFHVSPVCSVTRATRR